MNRIPSAPTILYNSAPHQMVARKWIRYNPYCLVSRVNIVIQHETLPNLALIIGWLQCKWGWSIAGQIGKENNKYSRCNETILARNRCHCAVFQASCKHSYYCALFAPDSGKRSGMKSNAISRKPGLWETCFWLLKTEALAWSNNRSLNVLSAITGSPQCMFRQTYFTKITRIWWRHQ